MYSLKVHQWANGPKWTMREHGLLYIEIVVFGQVDKWTIRENRL